MSETFAQDAESVPEHEYENRKTKEGYLVAQCTKCGYWLWETFHGVPACMPELKGGPGRRSTEQIDGPGAGGTTEP